MENLSRRVGYLKGLMEGMDIDKNSANGKLMSGIVDLLSDLTDRVEAIDDLLDDLNDYVESIDDDLAELEGGRDEDDDFDFMDEEDEGDEYDDAFGASEDKLHLLRPGENAPADKEKDEGGDALAGKLCPKCSKMFFTALDDGENDEYMCPHCGERIKPVPLTPENAPIAKPIPQE